MTISAFMDANFKHFNSATVVDAAKAWQKHHAQGHKMLVAMGGAMSTAEIGISLAEMILQGYVHAISCSANNMEEDIFNLIANKEYVRIPNYRDLTPADERKLLDKHLNRVTDTCIPEEEAFRKLEPHIVAIWKRLSDAVNHGQSPSLLPYQVFYELLKAKVLEPDYQIDPKNSWVLAACEAGIPIYTPGWEDSTLGNIYTGYCLRGEINPNTVLHGVYLMMHLADWYQKNTNTGRYNGIPKTVGFFQIGGGIAGDFPICVVPMLEQDMQIHVPFWSYFCQITDTNESYGSYSGANPTEKITWGKLDENTPKFSINSDATIVAPLIFNYVLGN